jgi:hypothetical protein
MMAQCCHTVANLGNSPLNGFFFFFFFAVLGLEFRCYTLSPSTSLFIFPWRVF